MATYQENKVRYARHKRYDRNSWQHYTPEEILLITDYSHSAVWLARKLNRSLKAIESVRNKINKGGKVL